MTPPTSFFGDAFRIHPSGRQTPLRSLEQVEATYTDGDVQILGKRIRTAGRAIFEVGDTVPVQWKDGEPERVLAHSIRRSGSVIQPPEEGDPVEEILLTDVTDLVAGVPTVRKDVYFRNGAQATRLNLSGIINADVSGVEFDFSGPFRVGWGLAAADNLFYVLAGRKIASPPAGQGPYLPRIYLFRLSRPVGEPAGAAAVSAALVRVIDPVTWSMPSPKYAQTRYSWDSGTLTSSLAATVPHVWPYSDRTREFVPIVESAERVTLMGALEVVTTQAIPVNGVPQFDIERIGYLLGVDVTGTAVAWEAATTDALRQPTGPAYVDVPPPSLGLAVRGQRVFPESWAVLDWTPVRKRVAVSWSFLLASKPLAANIGPPTGFTDPITSNQQAVLIEDGTVGGRVTVLDWSPFENIGSKSVYPIGIVPVPDVVVRLLATVYAPGAPARILLRYGTLTAGATLMTERLAVHDGTTLRDAAALADVALTNPTLFYRGAAVQYLGDAALYAIAEDSPTAGASWPLAAQRKKFVASPSQPALQPGTTLAEDGALSGKGALADWPAGIAGPDPLISVGISADAMRIAYHLVGTP